MGSHRVLGPVRRLQDLEIPADECELDHGEEAGGEIIVSEAEASVVLQPADAPFDNVAAAVEIGAGEVGADQVGALKLGPP